VFRIGTDGVYRGFKARVIGDLAAPPDAIVGCTVHDLLP
jgi:hypothetical protein